MSQSIEVTRVNQKVAALMNLSNSGKLNNQLVEMGEVLETAPEAGLMAVVSKRERLRIFVAVDDLSSFGGGTSIR